VRAVEAFGNRTVEPLFGGVPDGVGWEATLDGEVVI
jgi:hypothetical protein